MSLVNLASLGRMKGLIQRIPCWSCRSILAAGILTTCLACRTTGQDIGVVYTDLRSGRYEQVIEAAQKAVSTRGTSFRWRRYLIEAMMAIGRYDQAADQMDKILDQYPGDIVALRLAHQVYTSAGQSQKAARCIDLAYRLAARRPLETMAPDQLVCIGQVLLRLAAEPRIVLDQFFQPAIQQDPNCIDAYIAAGTLAIDKQDYQLAARYFRQAIARAPNEPDAHLGLARAFYPTDRSRSLESIGVALQINPRNAGSLLLLADHQVDCEDYAAARQTLDRIHQVNPWHPEAWAYKALLAILANEPNQADLCRTKALHFWQDNPTVDHLIGLKLSQKYRFSEGRDHQVKALTMDPTYLPARLQLAQDLLRLGSTQEGWDLVEQVHKQDPYNVTAYNLVCLRDKLKGFQTIEANGITVTIDPSHGTIYGQQVLEVLQEARQAICVLFGYKLDVPVAVEVFPNPQDFAVRTFGMPGAEGFLAVCFGNLITARAPSPEPAHNWHAVLWHEFGHVVTLGMTSNKMPRWLSEGISVYLEHKRDPTWGHSMTAQYLTMIRQGQYSRLSTLSQAFLAPPSPDHLQFAYYQSGLAVEFLVDRIGINGLRAILKDLDRGDSIEDAMVRHAGPLERLDADFQAFLLAKAKGFAKDADWDQPPTGQVDPTDPNAIDSWLRDHPKNIWALQQKARLEMAAGLWRQAAQTLERLIQLHPLDTGPDNPYLLLAGLYQQNGQIEKERQVLSRLAEISSDATLAYLRLMQIAQGQADWHQVIRQAERYIAVDPMYGPTYLALGLAYEQTSQPQKAIEAHNKALALGPQDPADLHYRLARLLRSVDLEAARRHIIEALAYAPRFRDGYRLLLDILAKRGSQ